MKVAKPIIDQEREREYTKSEPEITMSVEMNQAILSSLGKFTILLKLEVFRCKNSCNSNAFAQKLEKVRSRVLIPDARGSSG